MFLTPIRGTVTNSGLPYKQEVRGSSPLAPTTQPFIFSTLPEGGSPDRLPRKHPSHVSVTLLGQGRECAA